MSAAQETEREKLEQENSQLLDQVTQPLHGDSCSVFIEAKINGKKAEAQWAFTLSEADAKAKGVPAAGASPAATPKK